MCVCVCVLGQSWGGNGGGGAVTLCDGTGKVESYGDPTYSHGLYGLPRWH